MAPGAVVPVLSHYLKNSLHFDAFEVGLVMAMSPLASMTILPVAVYVGDRYISSERLLALCNFAGGAVMLWLYKEASFAGFIVVYFVYGLAFSPTVALMNAVIFHHSVDPRRDYGAVRMWGTVSWIGVAWIFGYAWIQGGDGGTGRLAHGFLLNAGVSFALGFYALTLPRSRPEVIGREGVWSMNALKVFARPSVIVLCLATVLNGMVHQFYYYGMGPYLSRAGFGDQYIMPIMSIGQISEVIFVGLLGMSMARFGTKNTLLLGTLIQAVRTGVFAFTTHPVAIVLSIATHGILYAYFFAAAYIYVNEHSTPETRSGVQQIYSFVSLGISVLLGYLAAGAVGRVFTDQATGFIDYERFWLVPATIGFIAFVGVALFFREEPLA